mmetsp:Transcript_1351/g.4213  ORF Transcript_1351/g.4213 Transcript_1351/m.4213 type:complete len:298 (+) Transcript_1351:457-1350(+)
MEVVPPLEELVREPEAEPKALSRENLPGVSWTHRHNPVAGPDSRHKHAQAGFPFNAERARVAQLRPHRVPLVQNGVNVGLRLRKGCRCQAVLQQLPVLVPEPEHAVGVVRGRYRALVEQVVDAEEASRVLQDAMPPEPPREVDGHHGRVPVVRHEKDFVVPHVPAPLQRGPPLQGKLESGERQQGEPEGVVDELAVPVSVGRRRRGLEARVVDEDPVHVAPPRAIQAYRLFPASAHVQRDVLKNAAQAAAPQALAHFTHSRRMLDPLPEYVTVAHETIQRRDDRHVVAGLLRQRHRE